MIIRQLLTNTFLPRLYLNLSIFLFHIVFRLNILVTMPSMLNTNITYSLVHLFLGLNRHRVSCLRSVSITIYTDQPNHASQNCNDHHIQCVLAYPTSLYFSSCPASLRQNTRRKHSASLSQLRNSRLKRSNGQVHVTVHRYRLIARMQRNVPLVTSRMSRALPGSRDVARILEMEGGGKNNSKARIFEPEVTPTNYITCAWFIDSTCSSNQWSGVCL